MSGYVGTGPFGTTSRSFSRPSPPCSCNGERSRGGLNVGDLIAALRRLPIRLEVATSRRTQVLVVPVSKRNPERAHRAGNKLRVELRARRHATPWALGCLFSLSLAIGIPACSPVPALPPAPADLPRILAVSPLFRRTASRLATCWAYRLMLNPELNEEVTVRPDGHISTTVVHDELAYGRTVPELTAH